MRFHNKFIRFLRVFFPILCFLLFGVSFHDSGQSHQSQMKNAFFFFSKKYISKYLFILDYFLDSDVLQSRQFPRFGIFSFIFKNIWPSNVPNFLRNADKWPLWLVHPQSNNVNPFVYHISKYNWLIVVRLAWYLR